MTVRILASAMLASWVFSVGAAEQVASPDVPTPYLPSTSVAVDEMLRLADVGPNDLVADLGSGDGRLVIAAARDYGARGLGIELDPRLVTESQGNARKEGVEGRVAFRQGDVLTADYRDATVVTIYLLPNLVEKLKPRLLDLKPGTRVVAHDYGFTDWQPDRRIVISKNYLLYVVPAKVAGKWRLQASLPEGGRDYEFDLEQKYQEIKGGMRVSGGYLPAFDAHLAGDRISFVLVEDGMSHRYDGRVLSPLEMEGEVRSGRGRQLTASRWRATKGRARRRRALILINI